MPTSPLSTSTCLNHPLSTPPRHSHQQPLQTPPPPTPSTTPIAQPVRARPVLLATYRRYTTPIRRSMSSSSSEDPSNVSPLKKPCPHRSPLSPPNGSHLPALNYIDPHVGHNRYALELHFPPLIFTPAARVAHQSYAIYLHLTPAWLRKGMLPWLWNRFRCSIEACGRVSGRSPGSVTNVVGSVAPDR